MFSIHPPQQPALGGNYPKPSWCWRVSWTNQASHIAGRDPGPAPHHGLPGLGQCLWEGRGHPLTGKGRPPPQSPCGWTGPQAAWLPGREPAHTGPGRGAREAPTAQPRPQGHLSPVCIHRASCQAACPHPEPALCLHLGKRPRAERGSVLAGTAGLLGGRGGQGARGQVPAAGHTPPGLEEGQELPVASRHATGSALSLRHDGRGHS